MSFMGMFHWGRLIVGDYGFMEGREQCLQRWLGLVVVSWLFVLFDFSPALPDS